MKCKNCKCEIRRTSGIGFLHPGYSHLGKYGLGEPCPCGCNNPQPYPSWLDKNMEKIIDTCLKAGMIVYGLLALCCAVLAQMVMADSVIYGAIIALNGLFFMLMFFLFLDSRHDIKIEKRLKALEELHRKEFAARAMVDMSIGIATGIAVLEGVAEQERKKKYELVRCEYCRKLWKLYRHNRKLQTAYCPSCKGQRKIKKLGWYEKGDGRK